MILDEIVIAENVPHGGGYLTTVPNYLAYDPQEWYAHFGEHGVMLKARLTGFDPTVNTSFRISCFWQDSQQPVIWWLGAYQFAQRHASDMAITDNVISMPLNQPQQVSHADNYPTDADRIIFMFGTYPTSTPVVLERMWLEPLVLTNKTDGRENYPSGMSI